MTVKPPTNENASPMAWNTAISTLEPQLLYRGYPADELASSSHFPETAYLLITGDLPTDEQLADWQALLHGAMTLPPALVKWLQRVPTEANATDVLLAALAREPLRDSDDAPDAGLSLADHFPVWLGRIAALTAAWRRLGRGSSPVEPHSELSFASNLWCLLEGHEPPAWLERVLDTLLILGAEHGFTPATLSVRMAAAMGSSFSSALLAGVSVARGPQCAGAPAEVLGVLHAVRTPDRAENWVRTTLERQGRVPGFRHRVYRVGDPRTESLSAICRVVAERTGRSDREPLAAAIEQAVWDQAQLLPALSWSVARILDNLGLEPDLFAPLYVISRLAGWMAHFAEQKSQPQSPVIRQIYTGPTIRHHRPLSETA